MKPFAFEELLARLRALIRRGARPRLPDVLTMGDLHLDTLVLDLPDQPSLISTRRGEGYQLVPPDDAR